MRFPIRTATVPRCATSSREFRGNTFCPSPSRFDRNLDRVPSTDRDLRYRSLPISRFPSRAIAVVSRRRSNARRNQIALFRAALVESAGRAALTRLHRRVHPSRDALTSRSVFVLRVPTGFPARRYSWLSIIARLPARLRHGLTRSDQPGVTTTHLPDLPRGKQKRPKKKNRKERKKKTKSRENEKAGTPFFLRPISKRTERLAPFSLFRSGFHSLDVVDIPVSRAAVVLYRDKLRSLAEGETPRDLGTRRSRAFFSRSNGLQRLPEMSTRLGCFFIFISSFSSRSQTDVGDDGRRRVRARLITPTVSSATHFAPGVAFHSSHYVRPQCRALLCVRSNCWPTSRGIRAELLRRV